MVADHEPGGVNEGITPDAVRARLSEFFVNNLGATLEEMEMPRGGKELVIRRPWGDASVCLRVAPDIETIADALNNVYLPEQFTAIWHRDTKDFEIIWTSHPLPPSVKDIPGRSFTFRFKGAEYSCKFARSSDRLLVIAKNFIPGGTSSTQFRNLPSFNAVLHKSEGYPEFLSGEPLSFWINKIDWNADEILEVVNHLNFYMTYYDTRSPMVVVHSSAAENEAARPQTRYINGQFRSQITGREIDDNLLHFWLAARTGDAARRFLYYYRIIEYASFFYLQDNAKTAIRRILSAPNALDELDAITERVVSALSVSSLDEYKRFESVIRDCVDSDLLWNEISVNLSAFASDIAFDGGFKLPALIKVGWRGEDFVTNGVGAFVRYIRDARNALSHGRDQRTASVIVPTLSNFRRLQPWVSLIAVASGQVIVYRHLI
jgi:hypothetical protein